jgi:hypothetical protein
MSEPGVQTIISLHSVSSSTKLLRFTKTKGHNDIKGLNFPKKIKASDEGNC